MYINLGQFSYENHERKETMFSTLILNYGYTLIKASILNKPKYLVYISVYLRLKP